MAWIAFPTDYLSRYTIPAMKEIYWIEAAPSGVATYVELAYTRETEEVILKAFDERKERHLLRCVMLPCGEAFFISYYHADWENKDLTVPGDGKVNDLLFSAQDPENTGRPIRICYGPSPKDGDALVLRELGGYAVSRS